MANILDIRRRIRSVRNTRQITKAMKMVSAARLRRAQDRALAARPYARMLTNVLQSLVTRAEIYDPETGEPRHPLLARREENTLLMLVVTGDRGLAGAFNTNILKTTLNFLATKSGKNVDIETIGRKGRDFLRRRFPYLTEAPSGDGRVGPIEIVGEKVGIFGKLTYEDAEEIAERVIERYTKGDIDAVYIAFNEFKSVISQRLVVEQMLPIRQIGREEILAAVGMSEEERKRAAEAARAAGVSLEEADTRVIDERAALFAAAQVDYIYEQTPEELFNGLLPKYVGVQIFRALLESVAAEHAARMTAMDSATNNASEMIDSLTLLMNRVRQAKITKEIIEVVSGAAAQ
ncbi:MAG TPA: ATP synthase F1 subunit gamma [Terriglobales bacterium]|jgi:F-type H+-transporting ATPase subunit gamma|nr:ATP synthase F1 subunit gamma [Terriglobales bacterium]